MGKRGDEYHDIASLFAATNLGDVISVKRADRDSFQTNYLPLLHEPQNSILRALTLFRDKAAIFSPVSIYLDKQIPLQAGLGGGSSNAATALYALNALFETPLSEDDLRKMALEIGSDVPFFFSSGLAYCQGRGEKIRDIDTDFNKSFWIAKPENLSLSTPYMYQNYLSSELSKEDPEKLLRKILSGQAGFLNDFEKTAFRLLPDLALFYKNLISLGFENIFMTGSGTAFCCMGDLEKKPSLPGTFFYKVQCIRRENHSWYEIFNTSHAK